MSFLPSTELLKELLAEAGFTESYWEDVSAKAVDWFDGLADGPEASTETPSGPGISVVLGPEAVAKSRNVQRNLREGRIQLIQGYFIN